MSPASAGSNPLPASPEELARKLELRVWLRFMPEAEVLQRCSDAVRLGIAAVTVPPCDLDVSARVLRNTPVVLGTVIDAVGHATTAVKQYAVRDAIRRGSRLVQSSITRGRMYSRNFEYVESELRQLVEACREGGAAFRLFVEPWTENHEELDILAARIARRAEVDTLCCVGVQGQGLEQFHRLLNLARDRYRVALDVDDDQMFDLIPEAFAAGCERVILNHRQPEIFLQHTVARFGEFPEGRS